MDKGHFFLLKLFNFFSCEVMTDDLNFHKATFYITFMMGMSMNSWISLFIFLPEHKTHLLIHCLIVMIFIFS